MSKVLIIGAGSVGTVVTHKCVSAPEVFDEILLASRTLSKCEKIAERVGKGRVKTAKVDADKTPEVVALIRDFHPDLVLNVALPYQDLSIMDACLETGVNYLDTANYEPVDVAHFEYSWQWAYHDRFKDAGIMALLGSGFDPGVTNVFTAYAAKHHFDEMRTLEIVDCNAGSHGKAFATNFNPEINIREITQRGKFWENGQWKEIDPMSVHQSVEYPEIGHSESYVLFHEELESLVKHFPTLKRARFWMTFSENYLTHLRVIQNLGFSRIDPVMYEGKEIVPLKFLKVLLPDPSTLGTGYSGKTSIGCYIQGVKDGKEKTYYVYNNCDHAECNRECGAQAIAYTTGVPAMIGAMMMVTGKWKGQGVFNMEQFDPDPFMEKLKQYGLPWHEVVDGKYPFNGAS